MFVIGKRIREYSMAGFGNTRKERIDILSFPYGGEVLLSLKLAGDGAVLSIENRVELVVETIYF